MRLKICIITLLLGINILYGNSSLESHENQADTTIADTVQIDLLNEISDLKTEAEIANQLVNKQRKLVLLTGIAASFVLVLLVILFRLYRSNKRSTNFIRDKNKLLTQKNVELEIRKEELKEVNATKDKLFSIIAHDIKTPLNSLLIVADMLRDKYETTNNEKRKKYIGHLNEAGKNLAGLIENLLSWSRFQIGHTKFNPTVFSVKDIMPFAVGLLESVAEQKNIRIYTNVSSEHEVFADFSMIGVVIRNITINAIKFCKKGGKIVVTSQEEADTIRIEIEDNGIGIDKNQMKDLFRVDRTITTSGTEGEKGTGLGLIICKEFVEKNGGKIGVTSKPEHGSTFWISLNKREA